MCQDGGKLLHLGCLSLGWGPHVEVFYEMSSEANRHSCQDLVKCLVDSPGFWKLQRFQRLTK